MPTPFSSNNIGQNIPTKQLIVQSGYKMKVLNESQDRLTFGQNTIINEPNIFQSVDLKVNNQVKMQIKDSGVKVTGDLTTEGNIRLPDSFALYQGTNLINQDPFLYGNSNQTTLNSKNQSFLQIDNDTIVKILSTGAEITGNLTTTGWLHLPDSFAMYQGPAILSNNQNRFLFGNSNMTTLNAKGQSFIKIDNDTVIRVLPTGAEITGDLAATGDCEFCTDNSSYPDFDTTPPNTYGAGLRVERTTNGTLLRAKDSDISLGYALHVRDDGKNLKLNTRDGLTLCRADYPRFEVLIGGVKVHGDLEVTGTTNSGTSDDRIKWNETPITNGLDTIRLLKPHTYDKGHFIPEDGLQPENTFREAGLIAQEVLEIPELVQFVRPDGVEEVEVPATVEENVAIDEAHKALKAQRAIEAGVSEEDEIKREAERAITTQLEARLAEVRATAVHPDTTRIKPYALNYNSIFTHLISAVKELDQIVQSHQKRIENLKNK